MTISGFKAWLVLVVLILSLCLNSFFVGAILTHERGGGSDGPGGGAGQEMAALAGVDRLLRGLPESTRAYVRAAFDAHSGDIRPAFRDLREARRDALMALGIEPFDPSQLDAAFARIRDRTMALQLLLHGVFLEIATDMPDEMRADMVDSWRDRR